MVIVLTPPLGFPNMDAVIELGLDRVRASLPFSRDQRKATGHAGHVSCRDQTPLTCLPFLAKYMRGKYKGDFEGCYKCICATTVRIADHETMSDAHFGRSDDFRYA